MYIETNIEYIKQEKKDLQQSISDRNSSSKLQSNSIQILYIYGKEYDNKNQIYYYCKTLDGNQLKISNQQISISYKQLVINYETFHSRLLFSELYQEHYQEIRTQAFIQTQQPEEIQEQKVEDQLLEQYDKILSQQIDKQKIGQSIKQINKNPKILLKKPQTKRRKINYVIEELSQQSESMDDVFITQINKKIKNKQIKNNYRILINSPVQSQDGDKTSVPQHSKMKIIQDQQVKAYGKFGIDIPSHISKHKMDIKSLEKLQINAEEYSNLKYQIQNYFYKVEWKHSKEGKKRHGNYYAYKEIRRLAPRLLVEYLQRMGKFIR